MKEFLYELAKRILDIVLGLIGLILLVPLTIVIWCANCLSKDNGPIFFMQERIGKNGKIYKLYKYRSMVTDADNKLTEYLLENEKAMLEYKKYKKLKNDPRVTKVGKFIRKYCIDEFPQFINVVIGQMSIVGPRPYLPREIKDMDKTYDDIIKIKPGLTGLWQIDRKNNPTFQDRLKIDKKYIEKRNILLDAKIFFKTFIKIFE